MKVYKFRCDPIFNLYNTNEIVESLPDEDEDMDKVKKIGKFNDLEDLEELEGDEDGSKTVQRRKEKT